MLKFPFVFVFLRVDKAVLEEYKNVCVLKINK